MIFGSICSGIEAASVAWEQLGWRAAWFSEIEPAPATLLKHRYPSTPNHGDMTNLPAKIAAGEIEIPDVLCGGTPCQAFSLAGMRKSLDDARGNLSLTFCEIANELDNKRAEQGRPPIIVIWENVPGVLSTKDNAFGCFLAELAGEDLPIEPPGGKWTNAGCVIGPKRAVAWRTTDAQYFGVAQRRRRVFVVASARNGFDPAEVLFEREGVRRDSAPSREAGEEVTPTIRAGATNGSAGRGARSGDSKDELIVPVGGLGIAGTLGANHGTGGLQPVKGYRMLAFGEYDDDETASTLKRRDYKDATDLIAFHTNAQPDQMRFDKELSASLTCSQTAGIAIGWSEELTAHIDLGATLQRGGQGGRHDGVMTPAMQVRRLTPRECERLQGFPDDYTLVPNNGKPMADGNRYKALGNSWAVPNVAWIGKRIQMQIDVLDLL